MTPLQWKRLFFRILIWLIILALLGVLALVGAATWRVASRGLEAKALHDGAQKNLDELYARKTAVDGELQALNTERGIETEIRSRFQVGKPGEEEIVVVGGNATATADASSKSSLWDELFGWWPWK